ncbi:PREDICTED: Golgi SNAP receptor complex member 2-like [Priapulus caudatus]|uniref:Golgi SNAP receptor complex member 2-like n=1 Tax=Priapulus caudatus TaxID=37621 RepID=A0ABM1ES85_PRICU|nr:PREDICTED: Golgi SNAP receptor complex member 2-like [Priapulus caudatus]
MEPLYHETNKILQEVHALLSEYDRAGSDEAPDVERRLGDVFDAINANVGRLEILVNKEPPTRRQNARLRLDQLKYDRQHLEAALRNMQHRHYQHEEEARQREQLLAQSFRPNDDASVMIDHTLQHHTGLSNAHREVDNLLGSGGSILGNLREQRGALKGVQKRVLDIANTLGMSNTVMRLIERRTTQDKVILWGGIIVTCVIMYLTIKYLT